MIPSDHFVRLYNEIFKYLDARGDLENYFAEIGRHQDTHCSELFKSKGLQGVYEYYVQIRREENCEMEINRGEHYVELVMTRCPSLSKVLDNDAGACPKYCLHCPGWTQGVYSRAGLYQVYDLMGLDNPQCNEWIFDDLECAKAKYAELSQKRPNGEIIKSFQ